MPSSDKFLKNILENMIEKEAIKPDSILVLVYDGIRGRQESYAKAEGVDYRLWNEASEADFSQAFSINFLSLHSYNASKVQFLINELRIGAEKIAILLTGDELDRWKSVFEEKKCLAVNEQLLVSQEVVDALQKVNSFFAPENPRGVWLKEVLGRSLNIIDVYLPFSILSYHKETLLSCVAKRSSELPQDSGYSVMLFTKPQQKKGVLKSLLGLILFVIANRKNINSLPRIYIWLSDYGFFEQFLCFCISKLCKILCRKRLVFQFLQTMSPERYFLLIKEIDVLIFQSRGGGTAARALLKDEKKVIFLSGSVNYKMYKDGRGLVVDSYKGYLDMWCFLRDYSHSKSSSVISKKLKDAEGDSMTRLKAYFLSREANERK